MQLTIFPIKTRPFLPPKDDLYELLDAHLPLVEEGDILLVTSKILAIHQGRTIKMSDVASKDDLIMEEAEQFIPRKESSNGQVLLTIKGYTLIPSAGIDESNGNGYYVLWPEKVNEAAKEIWQYVKGKYHIKKFGVIITDSHTIPLRRGVLGISIGFYGIHPIKDYRGTPDIFGRELKITQVDVVDALAAFGVLMMGEGNEQTPLCLIRAADFVEFTDSDCYADLVISQNEDIYATLLRVFRKKERNVIY